MLSRKSRSPGLRFNFLVPALLLSALATRVTNSAAREPIRAFQRGLCLSIDASSPMKHLLGRFEPATLCNNLMLATVECMPSCSLSAPSAGKKTFPHETQLGHKLPIHLPTWALDRICAWVHLPDIAKLFDGLVDGSCNFFCTFPAMLELGQNPGASHDAATPLQARHVTSTRPLSHCAHPAPQRLFWPWTSFLGKH